MWILSRMDSFSPCQALLHRTLYYCMWILFPMSDPITQNSILLHVDSFSHVRPYYTELYITACGLFFPCHTLLHRTLYYCMWILLTGTNLCSYTPKFRHPYVPTTYVPMPLCSYTPMFLHPYVPPPLYSYKPM